MKGLPGANGIRVVHVIDSAGFGGGERYVLDLVRHASSNISHHVVIPHEGSFGKRLEAAGCFVKILNMERLFSPASILELARYARRSSSTLIHSHGYRSNLYGRMAAFLTGKVHLCTIHVSLYDYVDTPRWLRRAYLIVERLTAPASHLFIAISGSIADDAEKYGISRQKIVRIPNGVDLARFRPASENERLRIELGIADRGMVIGTVGRLVTEKGQEYLIRALPAVKKRFPDITCLFIGEGPLLERLKMVAEELNVSDTCRFVGVHSDIERIYPVMDLFVLPSIREPFGLALLEAMASGVPVIATAAGGPLDFIKSGRNGMLVPPMNPGALSQVMIQLLSQREMRDNIAREGSRTIRADFDIRKTVGMIESIYCSLAAH